MGKKLKIPRNPSPKSVWIMALIIGLVLGLAIAAWFSIRFN